ncbi:MAG: PLP-dependent aspartate aminotransferase family protein [Leptospiraceae bacterium]|nr:PLP-dependent aspartate aminotransferase family protein [Leptospiraceae bacterium]MDW8306600.1 PLP-dependent aspartate aminotransferase family protein [Leptospiraceae bacterium]
MDDESRQRFFKNKRQEGEGLGFSTECVHGGEEESREHASVEYPIYQTATYYFDNTQDLWDYYHKKSSRLSEYGRYGNPTIKVLEKKLALLEGAEEALVFPSGMAAFTTALLFVCQTGDHIILTNDGYRGIHKFCDKYLARFGITHEYVPFELGEIEKKIKPTTRLLFSEFPSNPRLRVLPLREVAMLCRQKQVFFFLDATFATPYNCSPLKYGVDLVLHSLTKYLGGHNDLLGGALLGKKELLEQLRLFQGLLGSILEPHTAYLLLRSLKSFALRMKTINESAEKIAIFLANHPKIERVWYPRLPSHPDYLVAKEYLKGGGGIVSFEVKGSLDEATRLVDNLYIPRIAASLGGTESLVHVVTAMSYHDLSPEQRKAMGVADNMVRLAVGLEDSEDLIRDLSQALEKV